MYYAGFEGRGGRECAVPGAQHPERTRGYRAPSTKHRAPSTEYQAPRKTGSGLFELLAEGGELGFEVVDFLAEVGDFLFEAGDSI